MAVEQLFPDSEGGWICKRHKIDKGHAKYGSNCYRCKVERIKKLQAELAAAKALLYEIAHLCENCRSLGDAQEIAYGNGDTSTGPGCEKCWVEDLKAQLATANDENKRTKAALRSMNKRWCSRVDRVVELHIELDAENEKDKRLRWFVMSMRDVFAYNEYSVIDMNVLEQVFTKADCKELTRDVLGDIEKILLESGLSLLPTTNKAIKLYGSDAEKQALKEKKK